MSDKFVVGTNEIGEIIVTDVETGNVYRRDNISNFFGLIRLMNDEHERQNIQSKREESLNLKDYVETDERGHIVKVKLVDYIDDLIYERLNKKLEG